MTAVCLWALCGVGGFVFYTYLGYPLLLMIPAAVRRRHPPVAPLTEWPRISIVLPAYNEEAVIRDTLENLLRLDYPAERRQILVVSDASTDRTDAIVGEYASRGVELLRLPHRRGKTGAENAAVRAPIHMRLLPEALSRDFAAGLVARELGWRAVSVREAVCYVPRISSLRREYRRKVRTMTRGMETLYRERQLLNPVRYGLFSWTLASHKVCRWVIPHLGIVALGALACLAWIAPWARWALGFAGFAALCAPVAWFWPEGRRLPKVVAVPAYLVMGNLAPLHASLRVARGKGAPTWEPTRREAAQPAVVA